MSESETKLLGGKYELVQPAGQGGMASVWLGLTHGEAGFRRKVAIKRVLRHLFQDAGFEAMFVEEARVVADLNHPNIVQVHDFGYDIDGGYFIVMEWIEGMNLESYVRSYLHAKELTPWPLVSAVAIEVLRALSAAHQHTDDEGRGAPVIHRDVAPANILVGVNGSVKLTDFGLSKAMDRPGTTDPGTVKGKVAYMAPECLRGSGPSLMTDIYALGVTLWEAIAGRTLFGGTGTDVEVAMRVMNGDILPLEEVRSDIPRELSQIVARATALEPRNRYQRASAMVEALSSLLRKQTKPTDGGALSRSVREALRRKPPTMPPPKPRSLPGSPDAG